MTTDLTDLAPQLENCRHYWLGWGAEHRSDDILTMYRSGVREFEANGVLRVTDDDVDNHLTTVREQFAGLPWLWWVGDDSHPDTEKQLLNRGARLADIEPVMAIDLDVVIVPPGPEGLVVEQVADTDALREWASAYPPQFNWKLSEHDAVLRTEQLRADRPGSFVRFSARLGGRIVGTSALLECAGVAGVYAVSTDAAFRRQGIGAQLVAAALRAGQERGLSVGTLQATHDGVPLYERMGFRKVSEYRMYELPESE